MVLVLVLGDVHSPHRSISIPQKFKQLLVPGRIQHILITGNTSPETLSFLKTVSSNITQTAGDYDTLDLPETQTAVFGAFKVGITHGHNIVPMANAQSLSAVARKHDVDVLITGYTHSFEAYEYHSRFFVNPGCVTFARLSSNPKNRSITGAFSPFSEDAKPSFVLMDIQATMVCMYVYLLVNGEIKVEKIEFSKKIFD